MSMGSPLFSFDHFFSRPLSGVISEPWLTAKPEVATTKGTKNTKLRSDHYFVSFVCFVVDLLMIPNVASLRPPRLGGEISESASPARLKP